MKLKNITQEELENMSYDDIAFALLSENKKPVKIIDLFNEIGLLLNLPKSTIEEKIGDFFEMLTLDQRFIMLDGGSWDLRSRHAQNIIIDDDEDDISVDEPEEAEDEENEEPDFFDENEDDDSDDDLKDLVIIDDEEDEDDSML